MIHAIVFDFDGLILETEVPILQAWQETYSFFGQTLPLDLFIDTIGSADHEFDPKTHLDRILGRPIDWEQAHARRIQIERQLIDQQPVKPGVEQAIADAISLGLKLAVASSSSHQWVDGHLERLGLSRYFPVVRCSDDVALTKPDPALYLRAAEGLSLDPANCLAIEDSPNGSLAAVRAGMHVIAVPNELVSRQDFPPVSLMLNSLADLPLHSILQRVNSMPHPTLQG